MKEKKIWDSWFEKKEKGRYNWSYIYFFTSLVAISNAFIFAVPPCTVWISFGNLQCLTCFFVKFYNKKKKNEPNFNEKIKWTNKT